MITDALPPERIIRLDDPSTGLRGFIVVHSTLLGPSAGGCRFWTYGSDADASLDAVRLAAGMSFKNALAGLPFGGGKAVLQMPFGNFDRASLFRAFGRAVQQLQGSYITAEDVGTSPEDMANIAEETRYVAGLPPRSGRAGGDPSPWTAYGVFRAMEVAARRHLGRSLGAVSVAVQGVGHVGMELCRLLHETGARLVISEPRSEVAARAATLFGAEIASGSAIVQVPVDIFAPCALGGALTLDVLLKLRARIICGAANNQLASPEVGDALHERGILYAPDYLVNSGGIINVAAEYLGWQVDHVVRRVEAIAERLVEVLELSDARRIGPHRAADTMASRIIANGMKSVPGRAASS